MKLDKIKFAKLVAYLCRYDFNGDVEHVDELIDIDVSQPKLGMANVEDVDRLLFLMAQGTQKIEAIKQYRMMTGMGLKESKDAIERCWVSKPIEGGATLGDILGMMK